MILFEDMFRVQISPELEDTYLQEELARLLCRLDFMVMVNRGIYQ